MESTFYVSFRLEFFYLMTIHWIFDISLLCENSINEIRSTMYIWSSHIARVRINRVKLTILLVVSGTGKTNISLSPFAPENLVLRDGFGNPVPR